MKLIKPILIAVCLALGACGGGNTGSLPDFTPVGQMIPPAPTGVEATSSALTDSQIWMPANIGGPITRETYTDCQGRVWTWRNYIYQYKTVVNGLQSRYVAFFSATNWASEVDMTKNEITMQCSEDLQERNFSTYLLFPYKSSPTKPSITCDLYSHHVGAAFTHAARVTIPWDQSYYLPIASGYPIGSWSVALDIPPQGSPNIDSGFGVACYAGQRHVFNIDL